LLWMFELCQSGGCVAVKAISLLTSEHLWLVTG
jgi:hypothetical protein